MGLRVMGLLLFCRNQRLTLLHRLPFLRLGLFLRRFHHHRVLGGFFRLLHSGIFYALFLSWRR